MLILSKAQKYLSLSLPLLNWLWCAWWKDYVALCLPPSFSHAAAALWRFSLDICSNQSNLTNTLQPSLPFENTFGEIENATPPPSKHKTWTVQMPNCQWSLLVYSPKTLGLFCLTFYHSFFLQMNRDSFAQFSPLQNDSSKAENMPCWGTRSFSHHSATICLFHYHALLKATISADSSSSLLVCVCVSTLYINACTNKHIKLNLFGEDYRKWHQQESVSPMG